MCTSPLVRFRFKYKPKSDVPVYFSEVFTNKKKGFIIKSKKYLEGLFDYHHGKYLSFMDSYCDYMEIPCGRCEECKKSYARDWSVRCYHESLCHTQNCFVTLTIDNLANEKFNKIIEESYNGKDNIYCRNCVNGSRYYRYPIDYSLCKGLIYCFIKRLRDYLYRNYGISIRYFGCGEYGSLNSRPHYHLLIFGYNFPDIYKNGKLKYRTFNAEFSKKGVQMRISEELRSLWQFGNSYIEDLNVNSCAYVAKYCTKKIKGFDMEDLYDYYYGKVPEFLFMSKGNCQVNRCKFIDNIVKDKFTSLRNLYIPYCNSCDKTRGGLGFNWLMKNLYDVKRLGYIVIEGKKYAIPEYYQKIIKLTDENLYLDIRADNIYYVNEQLNIAPDKNSTVENEKRKQIIKSKLRMFGERDF